jgi:hypothetical protein
LDEVLSRGVREDLQNRRIDLMASGKLAELDEDTI